MSRSWFRFALLADLPRAACSRNDHSVEVFAAPTARRKTRPLNFETFEARRLLAMDGMLGFDDPTPLMSPSFLSSSLTRVSSVGTPLMASEKLLPEDMLTEEIRPEESGPVFLPPPSRRPRDDTSSKEDSDPPTPPTLSLGVTDIIFQRPAIEVYESAILAVTVTLAGGARAPGNLLTVTADVNFDGEIEAGDHSSERGLLSNTGADGRYSYHFFVPDDGPWPGNGTPTDKLIIRASYGSVVETKELTIKNLPPRFIAQPTFSVGKDTAGNSVARVSVQLADIGLVDVHTASVKWSDGIVTATQNFATIDNSCGPVRGRYATVERKLEPGQYVFPVEVRIADDDHVATADDAQLPSVKMLRLDLPLNDDDDNQSDKPDLAESLVSGEDDLRELDLTPLLSPQMTASGGKFYFGYDVNRLRVWDSADKQRLILPYTIEPLGQTGIAFENIPTIPYSGQKKVFVEGIADGQSSITLSWLSNIPYPIVHYPGCNPPIAPIPGGSIDVTVWSIDLDIDSDNNDGFNFPENDAWEEYLEDSEYGIGKLIYPNASHFTPTRLRLPPSLNAGNNSPFKVRLNFENVGKSGVIRLWNTSKADPNRIADKIEFGGNMVMAESIYDLSQLNYDAATGGITIWIETYIAFDAHSTKKGVEDFGKPDDRIQAFLVIDGTNVASDEVKYMSVNAGTFYPNLQAREELRNAIASHKVYSLTGDTNYALKILAPEDLLKLG
ncbi:MAG: hypothetical protein KDA72_15620, partial [Planctomycetales bacterium]|nr:hypothetical protein [Planctomycetales bacterium]